MPASRLQAEAHAVPPPHGPLEGNSFVGDVEVESFARGAAGVATYQVPQGRLPRNQAAEVLPDIFFCEHRQLGQILSRTNILGRQLQALPALAIVRDILVGML